MRQTYILAADTDVGLTKDTNQDSVFIKSLYHSAVGTIVLAVICDGMGGLQKGEVASSSVIQAFQQWISNLEPEWLEKHLDSRWVFDEFNHLIQTQNQMILEFGQMNQIQLGTTVTAMLIAAGKYYILHVGDTRVYKLSETLQQLTEDQTIVAKEVKDGILTDEQAKRDPRRNVLLQCVGASERVVPQYLTGEVTENTTYLLCTDGFRHELQQEEIFGTLKAQVLTGKEESQQRIRQLIELIKSRNETDNITAAVIVT